MNEAQLDKWLQGRPPEILHVLQVRAALRILSFLNRPPGYEARKDWLPILIEPLLLRMGMAWLRTILPAPFSDLALDTWIDASISDPRQRFIFNATMVAIDDTQRSGVPILQPSVIDARGIIAGAAASRAFLEQGAIDDTPFDEKGIDTPWKGVERDFWNCISYDTKMIERGLDAKQLAALPIWMVSNQFRSVSIKEWNSLKQLIEKESPAWVYWIKWYETVRDGKMPANIEGYINDVFPNLTLTQDNLETRIRQLIEATALLADDEVGELIPDAINDDANDELIIPPPRPAAIEPIWQGDKLVLLEKPPLDDGNGDGAIYALEALKVEIFELIESAKNANIDPRALDMLAGIASAVPSRISSVFELHRLGHSQTRLKVYEPTVESEWPNELRARYVSIVINYDFALKQFEHWRTYVSTARLGSLSLEEVKRIPSIADEIAAALRREEFSEIIDEKIPDSIGNLVAPLKGTVLDQLNEANELLAQDLLDSIDHIVKKLAVKSLAFIQTLSIALNELNNIYRPKAYKSLKKSAGKLGDETGPLIIRILQVICQIIITKISVSYGIDPITANTASVAIVFGGKLKDILNILKFFSKSQH